MVRVAAAAITTTTPVLTCIPPLPPPLQHMERVPRRVGAAHQQQVTCVYMPLLATTPTAHHSPPFPLTHPQRVARRQES